MTATSPEVARPLSALIAGGRSRRYGISKLAAPVGGVPLAQRARDALLRAGTEPLLVGPPEVAAALGLEHRADLIAGGGPLAGIHAALAWAGERGAPGVLCVACDMPFLEPTLLRTLLARAGPAVLAVAPASRSPVGCEPLCAWYSTRALARVEQRLAAGRRGLGALLASLDAVLLTEEEVLRHGDPEVLFLNVNTPADRERAEAIARARGETQWS